MKYLFLDFSAKLESGSKIKDDFFKESLKEQYLQLVNRGPEQLKNISFESFIETCFSSGFPKKYTFSCPNFDRKRKDVNGSSYLNNVVVKPELTLNMKHILPKNQNVILIGDICEGVRLKLFIVKGIQFIDVSMKSDNDMIFSDVAACNSFQFKNWSLTASFDDTLLTPDVIHDLIANCWTVKDHNKVINVLNKWKEYLDFRKYYIDVQAHRNVSLDKAEYILAYAVNRKEYRRNSVFYDDVILDGHQDLKKSDTILLSSKIYDAQEYPVIRLTIDRNKFQFEKDQVYRGKKKVNEEEEKIRTLANDNVFITPNNPEILASSDARGRDNILRGLLKEGYELGEKIRVIKSDILPVEHLNYLKSDFESSLAESFKTIDIKYNKEIEKKVEKLAEEYEEKQKEIIGDKINDFERNLNEKLEKDIIENKDRSILDKIKNIETELKNKLNKTIKKQENESQKEYSKRKELEIRKAINEIDVKELYIDRNKKALKDLTSKEENKLSKDLLNLKKEKQKEIKLSFEDKIRTDKIELKEKLLEEYNEKVKEVNEKETILRFSLYFSLKDINIKPNKSVQEKIEQCKYIVYDSRAEKAKINRQSIALENFRNGFVKNPYLSTYLFGCEDLGEIPSHYEDWQWYLESLNDKQKEAVRKAYYSNGIFLLQGPPGTGKTQVIAETVAHLVKNGKKVLISSETHKAIDNVFERLPQIGDIVPVRLIPSNNDKGKDNEYDPKFLVDNFYKNISTNMKKSINRYNNFEKNKNDFAERFDKLKLNKAKIDKNTYIYEKAKEKINELEHEAQKINSSISNLDDKKNDLREKRDIIRRTQRHIDINNIKLDDDVNQNYILEFIDCATKIFEECSFKESLSLEDKLKYLDKITMSQLDLELATINPNSKKIKLKATEDELRKKISLCLDEFYNARDDKKEELEKYRFQLKELLNEESNNKENIDTDIEISRIFDYSYIIDHLDEIRDIIFDFKDKICELKLTIKNKLDDEFLSLDKKINSVDKKISEEKVKIRDIDNAIGEINDNNDYKEIVETKFKLEAEISNFFKEFEITDSYTDIDNALQIIQDRWEILENNFEAQKEENLSKIPMYEKIVNYITSDDVIDQDRKEYTKSLFESANVFGITCTSRDNFNQRNMDALNEYNIGDLDIKKVGIDVVIIDEVSKSSFLDLLIPILYGKTIILVGDHRQLPPMYDLGKLREDAFEGLDEKYITYDLNKTYEKLYEECFFKTLFEKIPNDYKTMLVQQYRCHGQIMEVFNHFYNYKLQLGNLGQNNKKKHNIRLFSNGRNIIEPDKHVYFVDCKQTEARQDDSTSIYNIGEAKVVVELIRKMNGYFKNNPELEKLSIGVISTYGDQANRIKQLMKNEKIKTDGFNTKQEKMIVATVDDFQGDERDIIILTTVRNPIEPKYSKPGFILAYQRINVALSRARKLLIVVGNRKYLESKGVINLPDVDGNSEHDQRNFRVYEKIIGTIEQYGKVLEDVDVLEDKEDRIDG